MEHRLSYSRVCVGVQNQATIPASNEITSPQQWPPLVQSPALTSVSWSNRQVFRSLPVPLPPSFRVTWRPLVFLFPSALCYDNAPPTRLALANPIGGLAPVIGCWMKQEFIAFTWSGNRASPLCSGLTNHTHPRHRRPRPQWLVTWRGVVNPSLPWCHMKTTIKSCEIWKP